MMDGEAVKEIARIAQEAQAATAKVVTLGGVDYATIPLHDPRKKPPEARTLNVFTLQALVDYVASDFDHAAKDESIHAIHVEGPTIVSLYGELKGFFRQRECFVQALCSYEAFPFGKWVTQGDFVTMALSRFVQTPELDELLKLVRRITQKSELTEEDDGRTQSITVRKGLSLTEGVEIKSSIFLQPYRTFSEVEQVSSAFVVRVRQQTDQEAPSRIAIFEADGGAWKIEAVRRIGAWLKDQLSRVAPAWPPVIFG
jgi:hypothetical protein